MSDIIKNEIEAIQYLAKTMPVIANSEKEGILSKVFAKDLDPEVLRNVIKVAVLKGYIAAGYKYEKAEVSFLIDSFSAEILRAYGSIRDTEIGLAIHLGIMREFDDYRGLSLATFVGFIRSYMDSEKRKDAIKLILSLPSPEIERSIPTNEDLRKIAKKLIIDAFDTYKSTGIFRDHGNYIYDRLFAFEMMNFTKEQRAETWNKAYKNLLHYYVQPTLNMDQRSENKKTFAEIHDNKRHPLVISELKRLELNQYFENMKEIEADILDYLPEDN